MLLLAIGGELDTAIMLLGIFSDDHPAPSASPDAIHIAFPDEAVIEYESESGVLTVSGIKTADVTASDSIAPAFMLTLDGDDITQNFRDRLISLTMTDNR